MLLYLSYALYFAQPEDFSLIFHGDGKVKQYKHKLVPFEF